MTKRRKSRLKTTLPTVKEEGKGWKIFDWVVVIIFGLAILVGMISALVSPGGDKQNESRIPVPEDAIVLELVNGSGDISILALLSDSLRAQGIDVKSVTKKTKAIYPYTLLLDRRNNPERIDTLAKILGIPEERITLQKNSAIFEATLVIGRDFKQTLPKFFSSSK